MNEVSESFLQKAERSIDTAQTLSASQPEFSASRAYYAMFYVAEALLAARHSPWRTSDLKHFQLRIMASP